MLLLLMMVLVPGRNNVVHVIWYDGRVSRVQFDPISRYYCQHLHFFRLGKLFFLPTVNPDHQF